MYEEKSLESVLKNHLLLNAARVNFIGCFIIGLLKAGTVNLTKIALAMPAGSNRESRYKRIQRFFAGYNLDLNMIAQFIGELISKKASQWLLSVDRTNWKFGRVNINILMLGVVYMETAFPILWVSLDKKGNSNTGERIALMNRFISLFGIDKILCLVADREFIGKYWFKFLIKVGIKFRVRIKENMLVSNSRGFSIPVGMLFRQLKPGTSQVLKGKRKISGHELYIIGSMLPNGEYLILATDKDPGTALSDYKKRWGIETLFGCLKTRGFNFESTHLTDLKRIERLIAFLSIAFIWCHLIGEWQNENIKQIRIKKHGRKAMSIFRYGFDELQEILFNISHRIADFKKAVKILISGVDPNFRVINQQL